MNQLLLTLVGVNTQLLGLVVALVALGPSMIELVAAGRAGAIEARRTQRGAVRGLGHLSWLIWLEVLGTLLCLLGLVNVACGYVGIGVTVVAVIAFGVIGTRFASAVRKLAAAGRE